MPQSEARTGAEPVASSTDPFERAMTGKVTACMIPCMASETVACDEMVWPLVGMEVKTIDWVSVSVASGYLLVSRSLKKLAFYFPPMVSLLRST